MSIAPGPGDLGGPLPTAEPCWGCDGDGHWLCEDCAALVEDPLELIRSLREAEHALGSCEQAYQRLQRRRMAEVVL